MENLNYTNDAVMLLKDLIAIPSISRNEEKAADKLAEYLNLWH
jgi:acetylornithine deacetylase